jgi:DNA methylase
VLYGWKPTGSHGWYGDRKQTTLWKFDRPMRNGEHPTMKPIAVIEYPIRNSSRRGDIVVDLFGGFWLDAFGMRKECSQVPNDGARPKVLRRHPATLG